MQFATTVITCLFTKLHWARYNEETFRPSSQAANFPPVYHTRWSKHVGRWQALHCPFYCWMPSRKIVNTNFYSLWFDPIGKWLWVYCFKSRCFIHSTTDQLNSKMILKNKLNFKNKEHFWAKNTVSNLFLYLQDSFGSKIVKFGLMGTCQLKFCCWPDLGHSCSKGFYITRMFSYKQNLKKFVSTTTAKPYSNRLMSKK